MMCMQDNSVALLSKVNELLECVAKPGSLLRCGLAGRLTTIVGTDSQRIGALWSITKDPQVCFHTISFREVALLAGLLESHDYNI